MKDQHIDDLWYAGKNILGVRFKLNDSVSVSTGQHAGLAGSIISLLAVEPEPLYTVETSSGRDIQVLEHDLEDVHTIEHDENSNP